MMSAARPFLLIGAVTALVAVLLGAFGAHALRTRLGADALSIWSTAVEYQFYHALALLAVGLLSERMPDSALLGWSGGMMAAGIVLFSGSLYVLALSGVPKLGVVTPIGGLALLFAWVLFIAAVVRDA